MSPRREFPGAGWTTVPELVTVLRKRWDRGQYLQAHAAGQPWEPVALPVRAPAADELLERLDEAKLWLQTFQRQCRSRSGQVRLRIEYKTVAGRGVGRNELPRRVWVDSFDDLVSLLGVSAQLSELDALLRRTEATVPQLRDWAVRHPHRTLALSTVWDRMLATIAWIRDHETPHLYVRQIDVAGWTPSSSRPTTSSWPTSWSTSCRPSGSTGGSTAATSTDGSASAENPTTPGSGSSVAPRYSRPP